MHKLINVLLVDDNTEFIEFLHDILVNTKDIKIQGIAYDGYEALQMIDMFKPDIVVLDMIMPNLDGIGVLEKLNENEEGRKPSVIVLSAVGQDSLIQKTISLGAEYYMVKPINVDSLLARIRQIYLENYTSLYNEKSNFNHLKLMENPGYENDIEFQISKFLKSIGVPAHMTGYQYLREALLQVLSSKSKIFKSVTKTLYPEIAEKFSTSSQKVERSIRNSIESAWVRGNQDFIEKTFGHSSKGRPTNSEFIATAAEKIRFTSSKKVV
jgi:two-component system response regulator (stage 0 sporulation protein A)